MTHDELRELAAAYSLGALNTAQRAEFEAHLGGCADCRADVASMRPVVQGLAFTAPLQQPPPSLRAKVLAAARASSAPAVSPPASSSPWSWSVVVALAAAVVVAIGLGLYALEMRSRVASLESGLRAAISATERVGAELDELRQIARDTEAARAVLGASDLARIDLTGQPSAASARARAFWNRSSGLVFTASELPVVPAGRAYQLWVLTEGSPISAGMLQPDAGGSVQAFIPTPLDLPAPVGMAVTVEPAGGVPAPTTQPVLVGRVTG